MFLTARILIYLCFSNSNTHCQFARFQPRSFVRHFSVLHFPPPWFLRSFIF